MPRIVLVNETHVAPDRVLEAARDFSERRAELFSAVSMELMQVHELDADSADVTEATKVGPFGVNWERCRYEWAVADSVVAPVIDSNVYEPEGSSWEIKATPSASGSRVEMIWEREFKRNLRGRAFGTLFRVAGKPLFGRYARETIENLEKLEEGV